jgi:hypothetical protein
MLYVYYWSNIVSFVQRKQLLRDCLLQGTSKYFKDNSNRTQLSSLLLFMSQIVYGYMTCLEESWRTFIQHKVLHKSSLFSTHTLQLHNFRYRSSISGMQTARISQPKHVFHRHIYSLSHKQFTVVLCMQQQTHKPY